MFCADIVCVCVYVCRSVWVFLFKWRNVISFWLEIYDNSVCRIASRFVCIFPFLFCWCSRKFRFRFSLSLLAPFWLAYRFIFIPLSEIRTLIQNEIGIERKDERKTDIANILVCESSDLKQYWANAPNSTSINTRHSSGIFEKVTKTCCVSQWICKLSK